MDEAEIQKLIEKQGKEQRATIEKLMKDLKKQGLSESEIKRVNQSLKEFGKQLALKPKELAKFETAVDEATDAQIKLAKASKSVNENLYKVYRSLGNSETQAQKFADRTEGAGKVVGKLGDAAYKGSGKIEDYTKAFTGHMGAYGELIGRVGGGLQDSVDSFRTLANVGASFGQSLVTLRETAASAGLPLEDFTKFISKNSENLAALYGSTSQGATQFSKLSESFRRANIQFLAPLGLTIEEVNEVLLTNLTLQRRSGNLIEGSAEQQGESAMRLVYELDKLSKLTGQQRNELAKTVESQLKNERFLAFLGTQTEESGQRLSAFAASVGKLSPGLAEGFQDLIANAGVPVTAASRALIQNIPDATAIVQQLTAGTISSTEAMVQLRDAAQRSNQSLRGVAQTGTVEFARLFGEVNKLATAKFDEVAVTEEQRAKQEKLTKAATEFEDATKRLSSAFQGVETGFFKSLGAALGDAGGGINDGLKGLARGIDKLDPAVKAMLYVGKTLGGYFLDKAGQIATTAAGVALGNRMSGAGGVGGALKDLLGGTKSGTRTGFGMAARGGGLLAGGAGIIGGGMMASQAETTGGKLMGVGMGALSGAAAGAMFGPYGALIGALVGGAASGIGAAMGAPQQRATGTLGEIGLPFEPKTTNLQVHAGERVLNPTEAKDYAGGNEALMSQYSQLNSQMTQYNTTAKEMLQLQKDNNRAVSTLVAVNMATEKNTKRTSKMVDKVGPSLV